jgi:2-polyprenyl-6-methoxyphenol hydroxylase-like FAD-dependent oxidoreductase
MLTTEPRNRLVNRGSTFAFGDMKSINGQQLGDGSIDVSCYGHFEEDFTKTCGFDVTDPDAVKEHLRELLHDWSPELKALFENAEGPVVWRNLYMLPVGYRWEHKKGITLLGDAAHLMTPFAGLGVNNALNDALLLSRAIVKYSEAGDAGDLDSHIVEYEEEMFRVTKKAAGWTEGCMNDMMFTPGAPRARIGSYVTRHATADFPSWLHPVIAAVVHAVYFFYKLVY